MSAPDDLPMRRLLDVGRELMADLDARSVQARLVDAARQLTGARYAALRVLDEPRPDVAPFLAVGVDEATRWAIGELPRGRGVLGVVSSGPGPLV